MQHYPGRLHRLFLVGLPPTLHWMVDTVSQVLHPSTVPKLHVCDVDELSAPLRSYLQPQAPESPGTPSASWANGTVSLPSLSGRPNGRVPRFYTQSCCTTACSAVLSCNTATSPGETATVQHSFQLNHDCYERCLHTMLQALGRMSECGPGF